MTTIPESIGCQHENLKQVGVTTGECPTSPELCGCTGECQIPKGQMKNICKNCGKEVYTTNKTIETLIKTTGQFQGIKRG